MTSENIRRAICEVRRVGRVSLADSARRETEALEDRVSALIHALRGVAGDTDAHGVNCWCHTPKARGEHWLYCRVAQEALRKGSP